MKSCYTCSISITIIFAVFFSNWTSFAQNDSLIDDHSNYKRKIKLNALVVGRYTTSLNREIDYQGQHYMNEEDEGLVSNSFQMQYIRISTTFYINDRISTCILMNLAEFKSEQVSGKVLEHAFVSYIHSPYFNLRLGQFRPFFGLEDMYPFQLNNSYAWSNQYSLFGRNGWQSFQLGSAVFGTVESKHISYYLTVYNGNNRNSIGDNDSSKNISLRLEYQPFPVFIIGVNRGAARYKGHRASAFGIDGQYRQPLGNRFNLDINAEYKNGTNFEAFRITEEQLPNLDDYKMEGYYFLYKLRYGLHAPGIRALEFSFRQEYLNRNTYAENNEQKTYVPMISMVLAGNYDAKLSLVGVFNDYKHNIPGTVQYDSKKVLLQFQVAY